MKKSYPIEDQINDCFSYLRIASTKDAHDMSEYELSLAEKYLALRFEWVEHPDYVQLVPKDRQTGMMICEVGV